MIEIHTKASAPTAATEQLKLPFDLRQKSRLRTQLVSGEEAWLMLPRGDILRGGDCLIANDGRLVQVVSEPEQVLHITCTDATALTRAAYHLGNRHVPVQVGDGFLRIAADHVLADMLKGLGATLAPMQAPFEPEAGAYGGHGGHGAHGNSSHHHHEETPTRGARIHEYQSKIIR